jgi:TolB protein
MKIKNLALLVCAASAAAFLLTAQQGVITIKPGELPAIAIPDFRGAGDAQNYMATFNSTLWNEIQGSGQFKMVGKSMYPKTVPQQPSEFKQPSPWLTEWSSPPVSAQWLAFGYTHTQNDQLVLRGWLYNVTVSDIGGAQVIGKLYFGPISEEGARKVAREFAADILKQFGVASLLNSRIFFVSDRTGHKEIWSMDYDGSNQKPFTGYNSISTFPCVSPDGSKVAFTTYYQGIPKIFVHSTETGRKLVYYNQSGASSAPSDFTPDGSRLMIYSNAAGIFQIFSSTAEGGDLRRVSSVRAIEVEPKVNPKNPSELVFVSGRSGPAQIYRMNMDGGDIVRLTNGEGEAGNPSWHPSGQKIAFKWTKGFEPGNYNIFVMDVASQSYLQLTHGSGRNENPVWASDGLHIVYSSKQGRSTQIYTMLADGSQVRQLTTQGNNEKPVWAKGTNQ